MRPPTFKEGTLGKYEPQVLSGRAFTVENLQSRAQLNKHIHQRIFSILNFVSFTL